MLVHALARDEMPEALTDGFLRGPGDAARVRLAGQRQRYELARRANTRLQLHLPVAGSEQGRLVDGLVFYQTRPIGMDRLFAVQDRDRAPLGHGFTLLLYLNPREAQTDSGYGVTLTVPPESAIDLGPVLAALNHGESAGPSAPADGRTWWARGWQAREAEGGGLPKRVTMISAPRVGLGAADVAAVFARVLERLWQVGNPARALRVRAARPDALDFVSILELPPEPELPAEGSLGRPRLYLASLREPAEVPVSPSSEAARLLASEWVLPILAARLQAPEGTGPLPFTSVVATTGHRKLEVPGGFALVTAQGAWVIEDWSPLPLPVPQVRQVFCSLLHARDALADVGQRLSQLAATLQDYASRSAALAGSGAAAILQQAAALRAVIVTDVEPSLSPAQLGDLQPLADALDDLWSLSRNLAYHRQQLDSLENGVRAIEASRTRREVSLIAKLGAPLAVAALVAEPCGQVAFEAHGKHEVLQATPQPTRAAGAAQHTARPAEDLTPVPPAVSAWTSHMAGICEQTTGVVSAHCMQMQIAVQAALLTVLLMLLVGWSGLGRRRR